MSSRRQFFKKVGVAGTALMLPWKGATRQASAAPAGTPNVTKYVDALIAAIPKLTPTANPAYPGADYYEITMSAGTHKFHSQFLTAAATFRYGAMPYLGPTIEAQSGRPVVVKFINNLPPTEAQHPLAASIDPTVPNPMMYTAPDGTPLPGGRAVPHLHGGFTAPQFGGHPHSWFTPVAPGGKLGSHYGSLPGAAPNEAILVYSNQQAAANLWYHDHAMGVDQLNDWMIGLCVYHDYPARDEDKQAVADAIDRVASRLLDHDLPDRGLGRQDDTLGQYEPVAAPRSVECDSGPVECEDRLARDSKRQVSPLFRPADPHTQISRADRFGQGALSGIRHQSLG